MGLSLLTTSSLNNITIIHILLILLPFLAIMGTKSRTEASDDINAMMLSSLNDGGNKFWFCGVCNFKHKNKEKIFSHVDSKHYEYGLNCEICGKSCSTFRALYVHKLRYHTGP